MTVKFEKQRIHNYVILNFKCTAKKTTDQRTDISIASSWRARVADGW